MYSVDHWEILTNGSCVPICQPNKSSTLQQQHDMSCMYVPITLEDVSEAQNDARACRKLFKMGYTCSYINLRIDSKEADLRSFLYHHVRLISPVFMKPTIQKDFYFKKNQSLNNLSCSCFVSDEYGVALLKMFGRKLRCCYLNLSVCKVQFENVKFLARRCCVKIYKSSVWIISETVNRTSEIFLISFKKIVPKVMSYYFINTEEFNMLINSISVSENCLMFSGLLTYIIVDESKGCLYEKQIQENIFSKSSAMFVVNKLCLIQGIHRGKVPPKLYVAAMFPEIKIKREIDLTKIFKNFEHYIPYGFEMDIFPYVMKALIRSGESYILVLDLRMGIISQILTYIDCFWQHKLSVHCSGNGEEIRLIGKDSSIKIVENKRIHGTEHLCLKFSVWNGFNLKDLSRRMVTKYFSIEDIRTFGLPRDILKDIEESYM